MITKYGIIAALTLLFSSYMPNQDSEADDFIGTAEMLQNETIVLFLRAETDDTVGHARFEYAKDHPEYQNILDHIGELRPGETKDVRAWPD